MLRTSVFPSSVWVCVYMYEYDHFVYMSHMFVYMLNVIDSTLRLGEWGSELLAICTAWAFFTLTCTGPALQLGVLRFNIGLTNCCALWA